MHKLKHRFMFLVHSKILSQNLVGYVYVYVYVHVYVFEALFFNTLFESGRHKH